MPFSRRFGCDRVTAGGPRELRPGAIEWLSG